MANSIDVKNISKELKEQLINKITGEAKKSGLKSDVKQNTIQIIGDEEKVKKFIKKFNK